MENYEIFVIEKRDTEIDFMVVGTLEFWDEEAADRLIGNERSYLYRYTEFPVDDMRLFYESVFLNKTVRAVLCADFRADANGYITPLTAPEYIPRFNHFMPHPQLCMYRDLGDLEPVMRQYADDGNYAKAIATCVAATKSLNLLDSVVAERLCDIVWNRRDGVNNKAFEFAGSDTTMSPAEVIAKLKKERD